MLPAGSEVFIQVGQDGQAQLHPARVVAWSENLVTAAFADEQLPVAPGQEATLCYEIQGRFLRRAARVDAVMEGDGRLTVGLAVSRESHASDRRESVRVSTAVVGLTIDVDGEQGCPLLDVSAQGFAAVASVRLEVGQTADVSLTHAGRRFHGQVRVRSAREITPGHYRYGMYCLVNRIAGGNLAEGLRRVRDAVLRKQHPQRTSA